MCYGFTIHCITFQDISQVLGKMSLFVKHNNHNFYTEVTLITTSPELLSSDESSGGLIRLKSCNKT